MAEHRPPGPSPSHAGAPPASPARRIPEPTYAERARTLASGARAGVLSTISRRHPGHPFGSVMPFALDGAGGPLLLISALAMHTQNLAADPRASLLVAEAGAGDPLALGRVTLMGEAARVPAADLDAARAAYLARHPNAVHWVDFGDFAFWRIELIDVYWVGGFGAMDWLAPAAYGSARPDPLADAAADIMAHMNQDHRDALLVYARVLGGAEAKEAEMVAVDRLGFALRLTTADGLAGCRIPFPREVTSPAACREVLVQMLRECRRDG